MASMPIPISPVEVGSGEYYKVIEEQAVASEDNGGDIRMWMNMITFGIRIFKIIGAMLTILYWLSRRFLVNFTVCPVHMAFCVGAFVVDLVISTIVVSFYVIKIIPLVFVVLLLLLKEICFGTMVILVSLVIIKFITYGVNLLCFLDEPFSLSLIPEVLLTFGAIDMFHSGISYPVPTHRFGFFAKIVVFFVVFFWICADCFDCAATLYSWIIENNNVSSDSTWQRRSIIDSVLISVNWMSPAEEIKAQDSLHLMGSITFRLLFLWQLLCQFNWQRNYDLKLYKLHIFPANSRGLIPTTYLRYFIEFLKSNVLTICFNAFCLFGFVTFCSRILDCRSNVSVLLYGVTSLFVVLIMRVNSAIQPRTLNLNPRVVCNLWLQYKVHTETLNLILLDSVLWFGLHSAVSTNFGFEFKTPSFTLDKSLESYFLYWLSITFCYFLMNKHILQLTDCTMTRSRS